MTPISARFDPHLQSDAVGSPQSRAVHAALDAGTTLSQSVARAVTRRADIAFVAEPAPQEPAVAPVPGVLNWPEIVDGGEVVDDLDVLVDLIATLQQNLSVPSHLILGPLGWASFRKMKVGSAYNQSLLGAGTEDAQQLLLSLPVLVNRAITTTAAWWWTSSRWSVRPGRCRLPPAISTTSAATPSR